MTIRFVVDYEMYDFVGRFFKIRLLLQYAHTTCVHCWHQGTGIPFDQSVADGPATGIGMIHREYGQ